MPVGTGSIKRAAKKAAEAPEQANVQEAAAPAKAVAPDKSAASAKAAAPDKSAASAKADAKKPAAKASPKKKKQEPTEEGKRFMADEVAKSANEIVQLTQEMPVHLL